MTIAGGVDGAQDEQGATSVAGVFEPPGPGSWELDRAHVPRPMPQYMAELGDESFYAGFSETMLRYGAVIAGLREVLVNGFTYTQAVPCDPSEFPARAENAALAFDTRLWRHDLHRWDTEVKPATSARVAALGRLDLSALADDALVAHLEELREFHREMITQHHRFNGACLVPVGDFLARASEWTGVAPAELTGLLAGASPVSRGWCPEIAAAAAAIRADRSAAEVLGGDGDDGAVLERLRSWPGAVGPAVDEWVLLVGYRLVDGFDIGHPYALERPALLLRALRAAIGGAEGASSVGGLDAAVRLASVRALVPAEHVGAFDDALAEARLVYRLRDERGVYSDSAAAGLVRRAYLEAGDRLVARGAIPGRDLAVEAGLDELAALLRGDAGAPDPSELARRARFRATATIDDAPALLGDPPGPRPPLDLLPPPVARVMRSLVTALALLFEDHDPAGEHRGPGAAGADVVHGVAVSGGAATGRAVVVRSLDDLDRVEPGDVLVAMATSESYNLGLALAAAVVTDHGGALSHAAIIAREYGIPAVVGTGDGTRRIPDGAVVRVDGDAGEVSWS